jgi:2-C-methyl-D-erythritol 2,4-cyclodiphosphate synthase
MGRSAVRVGIGYDVHAFDPDRPLVLGGIRISEADGLAGHSDGDVLSHSIADALLGAAGLGDLGEIFPARALPEGVSSLKILVRTAVLLADAGYSIVNVDSVVIIQQVRIAGHRRAMAEKIAEALSIDPSCVSVKATTTDRLGFTGRSEGAAGMAVALVDRAGT